MRSPFVVAAKIAASLGVLVVLVSTSRAQTWTATRLHETASNASSVHAGQIGGYVGELEVNERASVWILPDLNRIDIHPPGAERSLVHGVAGGRQVGAAIFGGLPRAASWRGSAETYFNMHPPGATHSSAFCLDGERSGGFVRENDVTGAALWSEVGTSFQSLHDPAMSSSRITALDGPYAGGSQYTGFALLASLWIEGVRGWRDLSLVGYSNYISSIHAGQQVGAINPSTNGWDSPRIWRGDVGSATSFPFFGRMSDTFAGQQCGERLFNESNYNARVWRGSTASETDIHQYLPATYNHSFASGIWDDAEEFTYVVGRARIGNAAPHAYLWKSANILTAGVATLAIATGVAVSGDLHSLQNRDDDRLVLRPGPTFTSFMPPIQLIVEGTAPTSTPARISFSIESHASVPNLVQRVALWNFVSNTYEELDTSAITVTDDIIRIDQTLAPSRFIEAGTAKIRARITYKPNGILFVYPWEVRIDKAWWHMLES